MSNGADFGRAPRHQQRQEGEREPAPGGIPFSSVVMLLAMVAMIFLSGGQQQEPVFKLSPTGFVTPPVYCLIACRPYSVQRTTPNAKVTYYVMVRMSLDGPDGRRIHSSSKRSKIEDYWFQ